MDSFVETPDGAGTIISVNTLREKVRVRLDSAPDTLKTYHNSEIRVVRSGKGKRPGGLRRAAQAGAGEAPQVLRIPEDQARREQEALAAALNGFLEEEEASGGKREGGKSRRRLGGDKGRNARKAERELEADWEREKEKQQARHRSKPRPKPAAAPEDKPPSSPTVRRRKRKTPAAAGAAEAGAASPASPAKTSPPRPERPTPPPRASQALPRKREKNPARVPTSPIAAGITAAAVAPAAVQTAGVPPPRPLPPTEQTVCSPAWVLPGRGVFCWKTCMLFKLCSYLRG